MSTGNLNLRLVSALMAQRQLEVERSRQRHLAPASSISARGTPERRRATLRGSLVGRQPRQA